MRKYLVAGLIGLSLLGTQAAASEGAALSAVDRVGSPSANSNELYGGAGAGSFFGLGIFGLLYFAAFLGVIIYAADDNGGSPSSP